MFDSLLLSICRSSPAKPLNGLPLPKHRSILLPCNCKSNTVRAQLLVRKTLQRVLFQQLPLNCL